MVILRKIEKGVRNMKIGKRISSLSVLFLLLVLALTVISRPYTVAQKVTPEARDIQLNLKVYPNATVAVDGALNFTNMYPENTYLENATVGFSTSGNVTTETSNGTLVLPANPSVNYNATEAHLSSSYSNGLDNETLNATTILPEQEAQTYPFNTTDVSLNATYGAGLFDAAIDGTTVIPTSYSTVFPFNASDVTVLADFDGTAVTGNVTFHAVGGFPLGDVTFDFSGNRSSLTFTGNANVTYGNYMGTEINETAVDQMLNTTIASMYGQGPSSLYNLTGGYLQCTQPSITEINWSDPTLGEDIAFSATVNGSFTGAIAYVEFPTSSNTGYLQDLAHALLESAASSVTNASLTLYYYHDSGIAQIEMHLTSNAQGLCEDLLLSVPPAIPSSWSSQSTQIEAWLEIVNATAYAVTAAGLNASYSSAEGRLSLSAWLLANGSQLKDGILPILPDAVPSSVSDLMESFVNTTYCTLTSSNVTVDMVNGIISFSSAATIQGDLEAEINRDKSLLLDAMSTLYSTPLNWDLRLLNETDINIDNFQAEFEVGQDWMQASFSGLILKPQVDTIDPVRFELKSWLNLTNSPEAPPLEFDKLSITVTGESSANQTVLLYQPSDVPSPNSLSEDYTSMAWNNVSLSSLQNLMFLEAYEQQVSYLGGTYPVPIFTNSTVSSFTFNPSAKQIDFNVSGPLGTGFCNVTIPRSLLNATSLSDWVVKFDGTTLNSTEFSITENDDYVFVYLNYTTSEHTISIIGTIVTVPEVQPNILPLVLAISTLIAAMITIKQRRKLQPLQVKCRQALNKLSLKQRS
jgi:hypothetical protein